MKSAIDAISNFSGEKVLVLGSMGELGKDSKKMHEEIGDLCPSIKHSSAFNHWRGCKKNIKEIILRI